MPDLTPARSLRSPPPPGALDAVTAAGRRRRAAALSGGALGLAVLIAVPTALAVTTGGVDRLVEEGAPAAPPASSPAAAPAQPCPSTLTTSGGADLSVPAPPPEALAGALVPEEPPLAVSVCRYSDAQGVGFPAEPPAEVALVEERPLEAGLEQVPQDLALPPGSSPGICHLVGGPVIPHLVQLRYASDVVWLRTHLDPNDCALVTNGRFTSGVYVGGQVAASFDAAAWVDPPPSRFALPESDCPRQPTGRAGQERVLVPPGWDELVVCEVAGGTQTARRLDDGRARQVVDLLLSLDSQPSEGLMASCGERPPVPDGSDAVQLSLVFGYPEGRGVLVIPFFGCDPPLNNGALSASATAEQQAELLRLLKGD